MTELYTSMQSRVHNVIHDHGGLWPRKEIILKLLEELGELQRAFRKEGKKQQLDKFGDVLFALLCLAEREGISSEEALIKAIDKHIRNVVVDTPTCPDCGREKAQNVGQVLLGFCPKWYAIRDPDAEADCRRHAARGGE